MRIVLDTNILLRGHRRSKSPARDLLQTIISEHVLITSAGIVSEVVRALQYPKVQRLYGLSEADIYEYSLFLAASADLVTDLPLMDLPIRDPHDNIVLKTAFAGNAEIICTCDNDFFSAPAFGFCLSNGIAVYTDFDLLEILRFSK